MRDRLWNVAEWRFVGPAVVGMLLAYSGCSSDEPVEPSPAAVAATDDAKSDPSPKTSPDVLAAEAAFRTMTTQNATPAEWEEANQKLQEIGQPALSVLVKGLKSDEPVKREMASTVLAWFGVEAEPVAGELLAALDDESTFVCANVATALLQMPDHVDRVVPVLSQFLESDDADLKRMAATNLAVIEAEKAVPLLPQLIALLEDDDRDVVYYSTQLLGRIGPEAVEALPKLKAIDTDGDEDLKSTVTTALLLIDPDSDL